MGGTGGEGWETVIVRSFSGILRFLCSLQWMREKNCVALFTCARASAWKHALIYFNSFFRHTPTPPPLRPSPPFATPRRFSSSCRRQRWVICKYAVTRLLCRAITVNQAYTPYSHLSVSPYPSLSSVSGCLLPPRQDSQQPLPSTFPSHRSKHHGNSFANAKHIRSLFDTIDERVS